MLHALPFLTEMSFIPARALSPREPYSSLQTSRRYLRIRHGNKAEPAVRKSELKRFTLGPRFVTAGCRLNYSIRYHARRRHIGQEVRFSSVGFPQPAAPTTVENSLLILIPSDQL